MIERQIGVDFGTTTSVMHYVDYDESGKSIRESCVHFGDANDPTVPTMILPAGERVNKKGKLIKNAEYFGWNAYQYTEWNDSLCSEFKIDLVSANAQKKEYAQELTKKFFVFLYQEYEKSAEGNPAKIVTYVTYPSQFPDSVRDFLQQAAKDAGFPNVQMLTEAEAAMHYTLNTDTSEKAKVLDQFKGRKINVMLADLGGGTTDIAIYSYDLTGDNHHRLLGFYPKGGKKRFGGAEVDELLCDFFRNETLSQTGKNVEEDLGKKDSIYGKQLLKKIVKRWKETTLALRLDVDGSVTPPLELTLLGLDIEIDRTTLEQDILQNYLPTFSELVNGALSDAGILGKEIDVVMLTGGHSRWYFVTDMLLGRSGSIDLPEIKQSNGQRIISFGPNAQMVVARGAARYGIVETKEPVPPVPVPPVITDHSDKPEPQKESFLDGIISPDTKRGINYIGAHGPQIMNLLQKLLRF